MVKGIIRRAAAAAAATLHAKIGARYTLLSVLVLQLAACGGGGSSPTVQAAATTAPPAASPPTTSTPAQAGSRPTISGTPPTRVTVGSFYRFQPQATGTSLAFRTDNQPVWLTLNTKTGMLAGNPRATDIGVYNNIVVSVTDGSATTSLPPFAVEVVAPDSSSPSFGTPVVVPGTIDAERFNRGGEGAGYHDATANNTGGEYRPDEGVDIRVDANAPGENWVVTGFETGEWMAYAIDVAWAGDYELGLLASSVFSDGAYHIEIDGRDVTGRTAVPNTGSWDAFEWVGGTIVSLTKGDHVLKIVADQQFFDLDLITITLPPAPPPPPTTPDLSKVAVFCTFTSLSDCGVEEQAKVPGRASITNIARDGGTALRLHTEPGDHDVVSSGAMERDDVWLSEDATDGYEGHEAWWAHSVYFPDDFTVPTWESYVVFDFHNSGAGPWQANFHVAFEPQADPTQPGLLSLIGYGGVNSGDGRFDAVLGQVQKNMWYDFVYHVRWSSGQDGFFDAWVNGKRILTHEGPTLYAGQSAYLKLANYHNPVCDPYPACIGTHKPSSVIHDRVIRASTAQAVSSGPLEGYLDLVNGVLTPRF